MLSFETASSLGHQAAVPKTRATNQELKFLPHVFAFSVVPGTQKGLKACLLNKWINLSQRAK